MALRLSFGQSMRKKLIFVAAAGVASLFLAQVHASEAQSLAVSLCANCHGSDGISADPAIPKIAGMDAGYLRKQLKAFISGQRRNEQMSPVAATLSDDDVAALATHFGKQAGRPGQSAVPALVALGKQIYEDGISERSVPACASCHQSDGAGNVRFPRVAGQHQAYTLAQLVAFQSGRRATDRQMSSVIKPLKMPEMEALAEYMASLSVESR